jgi:phosphate uptake regulator
MKRKLVKQGGSALTITLPKPWVDKYGLKAGDDISVKECGRELSIVTEREDGGRSVALDATELNERTLRWALSGLHKGGYDVINVAFDDSKSMNIINELVKDLFMGFAVVEQSGKGCVLRSISKDSESEFDTVLRRAFLVTLSMGEGTLNAIKQENLDDLQNLKSLEKTNNQLTNFCERLLNKRGFREYRKTCFMYVIAWNLEKICDNYKYICNFLIDNKNAVLKRNVIDFYHSTNELMRKYYEIFYKFDVGKLSKWGDEIKELVSEGHELIQKENGLDSIVLSYLQNLIYQLSDFSASTIAINQED